MSALHATRLLGRVASVARTAAKRTNGVTPLLRNSAFVSRGLSSIHIARPLLTSVRFPTGLASAGSSPRMYVVGPSDQRGNASGIDPAVDPFSSLGSVAAAAVADETELAQQSFEEAVVAELSGGKSAPIVEDQTQWPIKDQIARKTYVTKSDAEIKDPVIIFSTVWDKLEKEYGAEKNDISKGDHLAQRCARLWKGHKHSLHSQGARHICRPARYE
eukprot:Opistho-2@57508